MPIEKKSSQREQQESIEEEKKSEKKASTPMKPRGKKSQNKKTKSNVPDE